VSVENKNVLEMQNNPFLAGISFPKKHSGIFFWSLLSEGWRILEVLTVGDTVWGMVLTIGEKYILDSERKSGRPKKLERNDENTTTVEWVIT
jgi:hypothetical protein